MLFSPDLFVVGGGISKQSDEFLPLIEIETEIVPATLLNKAGVVGAALYAAEEGVQAGLPIHGGVSGERAERRHGLGASSRG